MKILFYFWNSVCMYPHPFFNVLKLNKLPQFLSVSNQPFPKDQRLFETDVYLQDQRGTIWFVVWRRFVCYFAWFEILALDEMLALSLDDLRVAGMGAFILPNTKLRLCFAFGWLKRCKEYYYYILNLCLSVCFCFLNCFV